nr:hypothetical protein [uncultured Prevotella sp.]
MTNIDEAISLYWKGTKIADIEQKTKVARYTIYHELKKRGQPLRGGQTVKVNITIDEDVQKILKEESPKNVSRWFCDKVKEAAKGHKKR